MSDTEQARLRDAIKEAYDEGWVHSAFADGDDTLGKSDETADKIMRDFEDATKGLAAEPSEAEMNHHDRMIWNSALDAAFRACKYNFGKRTPASTPEDLVNWCRSLLDSLKHT